MSEIISRGGPVMIPLLICSLISLTIIIERTIFWLREEGRRDQKLVKRIFELARAGDFAKIRKEVAGSRDYIVRILVCGLVHREYSLSDALEMAASQEVGRMRKYLGILDTIITLAPLLGILGTVIGIINSFHLLGQSGIEAPRAVTEGIAQALITTAAGLVIALFTLIPYNYFNARVEQAASLMEKYATSLEITLGKRRKTVSDTTKISAL